MEPSRKVTVTEDAFGTFQDPVSGKTLPVLRYTLQNGSISVQIINYGATITSINMPDKDGNLQDIVLGFDDMSGYLSQSNPYFGATIGRVANRIGKGKFTVNGKQYQVTVNNGPNSLHGGVLGFDKKLWRAQVIDGGVAPKVVFSLLSPNGDEGYPGDLITHVTYQLLPDNQLKVDFQAVATQTTPVVLTNHSYFNLAGHTEANGKLEGHWIQLNADNYTPLDDNLVTKGEISAVKGTDFDLTGRMKDLACLLAKFPPGPNGYDNNFCINRLSGDGGLSLAGRVQHRPSGRVLEVHTDQPGVQFYTANFLPDPDKDEQAVLGKAGAKYCKHGAFCLETQNYPNAVNHVSHFKFQIISLKFY